LERCDANKALGSYKRAQVPGPLTFATPLFEIEHQKPEPGPSSLRISGWRSTAWIVRLGWTLNCHC